MQIATSLLRIMLRPVLLYRIFATKIMLQTVRFSERYISYEIRPMFFISLHLMSETLLNPRRIHRDITNYLHIRCRVPVIYAIVIKTVFSRGNTVKPVSTECQPSCSMWTDSRMLVTERVGYSEIAPKTALFQHVTGPNRSTKSWLSVMVTSALVVTKQGDWTGGVC